jgi:hypothetical protein
MAEAQGVSKNTVNRLWQLHNIKPHLSPEAARQGAGAVCGWQGDW